MIFNYGEGEGLVGMVYENTFVSNLIQKTSLEEGMIMSDCSGVQKWTWIIAFCALFIYRPGPSDNDATRIYWPNAGTHEITCPICDKNVGPGQSIN